MDHPKSLHVIDSHLSTYLEQIRTGDCVEVIQHVRERLWMADLDLSREDRAITEAYLDRLLECLEREPEPDFIGAYAALVRARGYWQGLGRRSIANFRDHLTRTYDMFREMVMNGRLDDVERELGRGPWLPGGEGSSVVDTVIAETNAIMEQLRKAASTGDTRAAMEVLDRLWHWIQSIVG